jgi:nucleotide-binding universal stress UspA family protein
MKSVLIPVDGSEKGLEAVRAVLADRGGSVGRIDLINVQPRFPRRLARFLPKGDRDGWREDNARRALEPARRLVASTGIACRTHVGIGPTATVIADAARQLGVSEIVVAATRWGPLGRILRNSTSTRLLESASAPVRVIPASGKPALGRLAVPVGVGMAILAFAAQD